MATPLSLVLAAVRDWVARCDDTSAELARQADVDEKSIRLVGSDGWNPRADTLEKLAGLLPPNWKAGDPIPERRPKRRAKAA